MEPLSISQVHLTFFLRDAGKDEPTGLGLAWVPCSHRILEQLCLALTDFEARSPLSLNSWPPRFQIPNASPGKICQCSICLLWFCNLFCKIVRHKPAWAYLKFLIFGAPVSSRTQRTKVRPWSLTGRQGIQHSYIDPRKWRCTGSVCCLWATYTRKYMVKHQSKGEEKQSCLFHCG